MTLLPSLHLMQAQIDEYATVDTLNSFRRSVLPDRNEYTVETCMRKNDMWCLSETQ